MAGLNSEQARAVRSIDGPVLVLAGAGSGKTRVITHRIESMLLEHGIKASSIIALSFTNKSAREMRARLKGMVGNQKMKGLFMGTFHSLGVSILKKHIDKLGYRPNFSIMAAGDAQALAAELLKEYKIDEKEMDPRLVTWAFSQAKNRSYLESEWKSILRAEFDERMADMFEDYCKYLRAYNLVDFDDLIALPTRLLTYEDEVAATYHKKINYLLIDEFQDTNPAQYLFVKRLLGDCSNLFVVGDDDQSIYGWRGADIGIILGFEKDFSGAEVIRLEHNYRSTGTILEAANRVIQNNTARHDKKLIATGHRGGKIAFNHALDEPHEASIITARIKELKEEGVGFDQMAILMRTNFQSRPFEESLRRNNIPYYMVGGYKFFDRKEVKDIVAYLRAIANPKDEVALLRIINTPKRGIGAGTIKKLADYTRDKGVGVADACTNIGEHPELMKLLSNQALSAVTGFFETYEEYRGRFSRAGRGQLHNILKDLVAAIGYETWLISSGDKEEVIKAKMYNIGELVSSLAYFEENWDESAAPTLFDYLGRIALQFEDQEDDEQKKRSEVQLLTVHLSKGLEFPYVFVVGMENGLFPNGRAVEERDTGLEEERRLFYVAVTRAMQKLILSACQTRKKFGETIETELSPFIDELGADLLDHEIWDAQKREAQVQKEFTEKLNEFKALFS